MKSYFKFFSIFLSLIIVLLSILNCNLIVYASEGVYPPGTSTLEKVIEEGTAYIMYLGCRLKAVADGDFAKWIQTKEDYKEWWNTGHISSDNNGNIVFDDSLVNYIKQALTEYAEESCGFWIVPTRNFNLIGANNFTYKASYETLKNIVKEKEIVLLGQAAYFRHMYFHDIYNYDMPFVLVCSSSNYDYEKNFGYDIPVYYYGADNWLWYSFDYYWYSFGSDTASVESFDGLKDVFYHASKSNKYATSFYVNVRPSTSYGNSQEKRELFSNDGRRVKVYKSLDAFKYADTNTRPVYFGSGFYDDVGEVKVSFDELQDYLDGKYDSFFDDLKDLLPDNDSGLSEDEIEKIVDKLLGQLGEVGDKVDGVDGSLKETNSILGNILSALSGYFESVLAYLDSILTSIQGLIYVETVKPDDEHLDLSDMINDVWKDPQNGSQAVADSLSASFSDIGSALMAKFPFCIPNDLYSLFKVFADIPESRAAPMSLDDGGIETYAGGTSAPRFELPLVIESFGIEETVIIDMSEFTPLSKNARTFLSLIFAVALMKFSAVVIGFINDAWG